MKLPVMPPKALQGQTLKLILPIGKSVNHCYIPTRTGIKILTKEAKQWFSIVNNIIRKEVARQGWLKTDCMKVIAEAKVYWKDRRTRDTHNLDKNLCDAMEGLVIDNDCYLLMRWVDWSIDKENPRIELVVRMFNPQDGEWNFDKE